MKNWKILTFLISAVVLTIFVVGGLKLTQATEVNAAQAYLRIHIRANSNSEADQAVKLKVKEAVVNFLTPKVNNCASINEAHAIIERNLTFISAVATQTLNENGFNYAARARINDEFFPTRAYQDLVLGSGVYDALIIELGSGTGDNWWCVIYPPLCFVGENNSTNNIVFKSKIWEILNKN